MSDRIYVVSAGTYSDYAVLCACNSKSDAAIIAKKVTDSGIGWRGDARVESLPVVTSDVAPVSVLRLSENIFDDDRLAGYDEQVRVEWPFDSLFGDAVPLHWRWVRAPIHEGKGGRLEVSGTDHERVRKVFSERKALLRTDDAFRARREVNGR